MTLVRKLGPVFFLSLTGQLAEAVTPPIDCLIRFTALAAAEPQNTELALSTYERLLDVPSESGAKQRLIEALAQAKDPFAVPNDGRLISVKKQMIEFKQMLKGLGWDTPELRARQLDVVRQHLAGQTAAKQGIDQTVGQNTGVKVFSIDNANFVRQTPDGRFFISFTKTGNAGSKANVYDGVTGKREVVELANSGGIHPTNTILTSDGTKLVGVVHVKMTSQGGRVEALQSHEIVNGRVSPTGKRIPLKNDDGSELVDVHSTVMRIVPLNHPDWVVIQAIYGTASHYRLVDLAKGTTHRFTEEPKPTSKGGGWEPVRGRDALVVVTDPEWPEKAHGLVVIEVGAGGKTAMRRIPLPPGMIKPEISDTQGDSIALHEVADESAYVVSTKSGPRQRLAVPRPRADAFEPQVLLHPNGKELGVMGVDRGTNEFQVHWTNLVSNQKVGDFRVPMGSYKLSPDGESILVLNKDSVRVIPIHRHVDAKDRPSAVTRAY